MISRFHISKKRFPEVLYVLLITVIALFLLIKTPDYLTGDAPGYISFNPIRPPLYPLFIWLFHWAGTYQFTLIMWIQTIMTCCALFYARSWLRKHLNIPDFLVFTICVFVVVTTGFHFQFWTIISEGLSFPFFIWTFFLLIECLKEFNLKKITYLSLLVALLVLTRLQFFYFYGIFIVLIVWHLYQKVPLKKLGFGIIILLTFIALTFFVDRSYHYFKHGFFGGEPAMGKILLVQPLFLASKSADNYFTNPEEKKYVQIMLDQIHQKKLNKDVDLLVSAKPSFYEFAYESYLRNYLAIYGVIKGVLAKKTPTETSDISVHIFKMLFLHDTKKNILFFLWKFVFIIGGIPLLLFFFIIILAMFISMIHSRNSKYYSQLFVSMILLVTFLNAGVVALFEPYSTSYFCYSQFMFYCLGALLAHRIFSNKMILDH